MILLGIIFYSSYYNRNDGPLSFLTNLWLFQLGDYDSFLRFMSLRKKKFGTFGIILLYLLDYPYIYLYSKSYKYKYLHYIFEFTETNLYPFIYIYKLRKLHKIYRLLNFFKYLSIIVNTLKIGHFKSEKG